MSNDPTQGGVTSESIPTDPTDSSPPTPGEDSPGGPRTKLYLRRTSIVAKLRRVLFGATGALPRPTQLGSPDAGDRTRAASSRHQRANDYSKSSTSLCGTHCHKQGRCENQCNFSVRCENQCNFSVRCENQCNFSVRCENQCNFSVRCENQSNFSDKFCTV
ncbi:hypothetical protein Bbelb_142910 [Branchiostoma belcheri]|nr:hypothetical protein Bbelb_142910 [Branchiostoma belcheri]